MAHLLAEAGVGGSLAISGMQISHGGFISARAGSDTASNWRATGRRRYSAVGVAVDASGVNKKLGGVSTCARRQSEPSVRKWQYRHKSRGCVPICRHYRSVRRERCRAQHRWRSDAGTLSIKAEHGILSLGGTLLGSAAAGKRQGSVELDVGSLSNYTGLNDSLAASGFTQSLDARVRNGNVLIGAADVIRAHQYKLSADKGSITVSGTVEAEGAAGGRIELYAGNNVTLTDGASLRANATANGERGAGSFWVRRLGRSICKPAAISMPGPAKAVQGRVLFRAPNRRWSGRRRGHKWPEFNYSGRFRYRSGSVPDISERRYADCGERKWRHIGLRPHRRERRRLHGP